jgi:FkbM family methyltransferase
MKPMRLSVAQAVCRYLPPLISPRVRAFLYPQSRAYSDNYRITTNSQTGSPFSSTTGDYQGYRFAVHGYLNWRAWAIALAVCAPGDTILEIGANIGTETVGFADIVGCSGHVFAFEPLPSNYQALTRTLKLRHCENVTLFPFALSDKRGSIFFKIPVNQHSSGEGRIVESINQVSGSPNLIKIESYTLDSLKEEVGKASLVFMDAEGSEYSIIRGGYHYFRDYKPAIILEAGTKQLGQHGLTLQDLYDEVTGLEYAIFDIARFGLKPVTPQTFSFSTMNWLCIPASKQPCLITHIQKQLFLCGLMPCVRFCNPLSKKRY